MCTLCYQPYLQSISGADYNENESDDDDEEEEEEDDSDNSDDNDNDDDDKEVNEVTDKSKDLNLKS